MERQVIRYVNNVVYVSNAYYIWKDPCIFYSSSMGNHQNIVFRCVATTVFDGACIYGACNIGIPDFGSGWILFLDLSE